MIHRPHEDNLAALRPDRDVDIGVHGRQHLGGELQALAILRRLRLDDDL